jgi:hypothetical protein
MSEVEKIAAAPNPYRTMDESGSPNAAGTVAWNWIGEMAAAEREADAATLAIESSPVSGGGQVSRLYRGSTLIAVATTFRDEMNFTVLIRWLSPDSASLRRHLQEQANVR